MRRGVVPAFAGKQRYRQGGWDCAHGCQGVHFNPKDVECEDQNSQVPQPTQAVGEALAILAKKTNVVDPKHRKNCECCPVSQLIVRQE